MGWGRGVSSGLACGVGSSLTNCTFPVSREIYAYCKYRFESVSSRLSDVNGERRQFSRYSDSLQVTTALRTRCLYVRLIYLATDARHRICTFEIRVG